MTKQRLQQFILAFNVATIGLWGWVIVEFLSRGAAAVPRTVADLYLLFLVAYAGDKEVRRWRNRHQSVARRGEYFVLGWALTAVVTFGLEILGGKRAGFTVPDHLPLITGSVLVVFIATEYLKSEYRRRGRQAA